MSKGWECPVCGKGVAPTEKTCGHGGAQPVYTPYPQTAPDTSIKFENPYEHVLPDWNSAKHMNSE